MESYSSPLGSVTTTESPRLAAWRIRFLEMDLDLPAPVVPQTARFELSRVPFGSVTTLPSFIMPRMSRSVLLSCVMSKQRFASCALMNAEVP